MPQPLRPLHTPATLAAMATDRGQDPLSRALDHLVTRFRRIIETVGLRHGVTRADLDELVQDVRIRLWRARQDADALGDLPSSYVYQAAVHAVLDRARARRTASAVERPIDALPRTELPTAEPDAEQRLANEALHTAVEDALATLGTARATVVRLHLVGYSRHDIAQLTGWTEAKVRNLTSRGLADLRTALRANGTLSSFSPEPTPPEVS